ncbi:hypothetical protein PtA15_17A416 [Puccinia triticina]|uniref:Uncharacterized protein n=1 Tax=Puccinia triticina TaxID=208348 RepID=A0ABY7D839_9BASI|nr:uncharacterized protein PtA15_17A416 [Puccinia triticina]WAQ92934.1 hypothetical protein PtA15_17A416 [Puccinia triticina]
MSDTETEPDHETQPVGIQGNVSPGIDFRLNGVEPSKLDDHLLPKEDDHSVSTQAHTVKSAVETLSQAILESDLENDDTLNLGLARAAQTISNFLKLAKLTVATEEDYDRLPGWMREDLIECLDMILSERFLNALFLLRQNISHLAIKREHVASSQMVTLSDVVIAAIVDYFECLEETAKYLRVVNTLLENRAIGLKHLLGMKKDEKYIKESGIEEHFPKYTTLAVLQTYSAVSGLPTELLSKEENDEICTQVEKVIQVEIDGSFEGSTRLEVIDMTLSLPQSASDRLIQSLQIRFNLMLESLLLEIEVSADPTCCHEEKLLHQQRALSKLKFLTKCVEIQSLKEYLVKGAIFNLVNTLLTPLGCDHTVALATTKLILCISKSAKESWPLNQQQLQTVSNALIEVMADGHGTSVERKRWQRGEGVVASLVTADFVKGYCARFDYQVNYPLAIYGALREELADELWIHSGARSQTKSHLTNSGSNRSFHYGPSAPETHPGILVAEAMQILFKRFSDAQSELVASLKVIYPCCYVALIES